jgi:hypothetical protein
VSLSHSRFRQLLELTEWYRCLRASPWSATKILMPRIDRIKNLYYYSHSMNPQYLLQRDHFSSVLFVPLTGWYVKPRFHATILPVYHCGKLIICLHYFYTSHREPVLRFTVIYKARYCGTDQMFCAGYLIHNWWERYLLRITNNNSCYQFTFLIINMVTKSFFIAIFCIMSKAYSTPEQTKVNQCV